MTVRKVAILLPSLHFGGAERATLTLARALRGHGVAVDILVMQKKGQFLSEAVDMSVVDLKCKRTFQLPFALMRYMIARSPDMLISNFWKLSLCACLTRIFYPFCKLLIWEHAMPSSTPIHSAKLYGWTASIFYLMGTKIIAVSSAVRDDILSISFGLEERTVVINNPVPEPRDSRHKESRDFIFVGRLDPQKNPMLALEAFAIISKETNTTMVFVGDGMLRGSLERRVAQLGLADKVHFTGFVSDPAPYMRAARVLVLSSNSEGLGNVLVEGLYCGLGMVSTACGGPTDVLCDQLYGRLVPVGDDVAMARAMKLELAQPRDAITQREAALRFSPDRVATEFLFYGYGQDPLV